MRKYFLQFWPMLFILLVWFIFSSPYFVKGLVPYPSTYQVNHFPPWSDMQKYWGPVKNGAMPDIIDQIYPWKHFTIEMLKSGQFPWWNPYNFAGNPHVGDFQSAVFSPVNFLYFVLPFVDAWSLIILLQPLLAAFFMYLLLRSFKVSALGASLSAITFMFSGFMVVWMAYGTLSMALCFLPLALYSIEKWYQSIKTGFLLLLSFSIALSIFSGHFQTSIYVLLGTGGFWLYKIVTTSKVRESVYIAFALLFGLLISLVQLIPSISLYQESVRSNIFINSGGIPLPYLITSIAGDFFGNPVTRNDWFGYYAEWASFVGIIPLLLALFSWNSKIKSSKIFFWVLAIGVLALVVDSPIQSLIGSLKIPVISTSNPSRIIALFSFSVAVLSGFGFDYLKEKIKGKKWSELLWPILSVGLVLLITWTIILFFKPFSPDKLSIAKRNLILPTGLFGGFVMLLILSCYQKKAQMFLIGFLILATSFDSLRYVQKWMPFDPKSLIFPDTPVVTAMQRNIGSGRVFGNFGADVSTYYNLPTLDGYDPLYVERYGKFIQTASTGGITEAQRSVVTLDRVGKYTDRVLDVLGVSLIFHPIADTNQSWAYPVWKDSKRFDLVYKDDLFQLFGNKTALSHATLFYKYEVVSDGDMLLKKFYSDGFDFRNELLLEQDPHLVINSQPNGSAKIIKQTPNDIIIAVSSNSEGLLFLSDVFYKNWHAVIKQGSVQKETPILRADYAFRAVRVPKGESIVEFSYQEF